MKRIKITEKQARMIKEMANVANKNKTLKITESQYKKILEMEKSLNLEAPRAGDDLMVKSFKEYSEGDVKKIYEDFISELYGLNETKSGKYENLYKIMEACGLIENRKIRKEKFGNSSERVREVLSKGLSEMYNGASDFRVMEVIENTLKEDNSPVGSDLDPNNPSFMDDKSYEEEEPFLEAKTFPFELIYFSEESDNLALFERKGDLFVHISKVHGEEVYEDFCPKEVGFVSAECINNLINYQATEGDLDLGGDPFNNVLAKINPDNTKMLLSPEVYGTDEGLVDILNSYYSIYEVTSAGGGPSATSNAGPYDANALGTGSFMTQGNKLNRAMNSDGTVKGLRGVEVVGENAQKDTQYPGGGFVKFDDCTKLNNNKVAQNGGCNQGADVIKVKGSKNSVIAKENVYETLAKRTGKSIKEIKNIINKSK